MVSVRIRGVTLACLPQREVGKSARLGCVVVGAPAKALLIERRLRNATRVAEDGNEGASIGKKHRSKDAQSCGRTRWSVVCCLLFVVYLLHG